MVTIPAQFNGPVGSGNGGYVCGTIAAKHGADVATVSLRIPPPLDAPLTWERSGEVLRLVTAGGALVGDAAPGSFAADPPDAVPADVAARTSQRYVGFEHHPFARCFTCGTARDEGDGLRIFPGPVDGRDGLVAAPWTPLAAFAADGVVPAPITWAAIDCPGGWAADFTRHVFVLARMTGQVLRAPQVGEPCVAVGRFDREDGRKFSTSSALYAGDELLARSEQLWITVDPATVGVAGG